MLNQYPYSNGHLLIAPRNHIAELNQLNIHENLAIMTLLADCTTILGRHLKPVLQKT